MSLFEDREFLTPFGVATCFERVDFPDQSFWICFIKETGICFWFQNKEVRLSQDLSNERYKPMPFRIAPERVEALDKLGQQHTYWRENINPGTNGGRGDVT